MPRWGGWVGGGGGGAPSSEVVRRRFTRGRALPLRQIDVAEAAAADALLKLELLRSDELELGDREDIEEAAPTSLPRRPLHGAAGTLE